MIINYFFLEKKYLFYQFKKNYKFYVKKLILLILFSSRKFYIHVKHSEEGTEKNFFK